MLPENLNIVDGNIYAYLLYDYQSSEILDGNKLARTFYKNSGHFPKLDTLFSPNADGETITKITTQLNDDKSFTINGVTSIKNNGDSFPCHIEICRVSGTILFLVIKENNQASNVEIEQLVEVFDNPILVLKHDEKLTTIYGNTRCYNCIRMNKEIFESKNRSSFLSILQDDKRIGFMQTVNQQLDLYGECDVDIEISLEEDFFQLFRLNAFKSTFDGMLYGVLISAKKQSDLMKKIEYDQQYFDIMQQFSKDLLFRIDIKKRTLVHRGDISRFIGLSPEVQDFPESMRDTRLIHPDDLEGYIAFAYRLMNGASATFEPRFQFDDGSFEKYRLQASPLFDTDGNVVQVVGKSENIQKYVEIETKANYDQLTSALNKQSFRELVEHNISRAVASDKFALLFIDLDDFKGVNDNMGHVFGDFLLEATGKRILNCIRSQDRVGRVGGDEFAVFFQFAPTHEAVLERAEAILHSLRREFTYSDQRYTARASIGIAIFPEHGNNYDDLYNNADKALYKSKSLGKDLATIYDKEFDKQ